VSTGPRAQHGAEGAHHRRHHELSGVVEHAVGLEDHAGLQRQDRSGEEARQQNDDKTPDADDVHLLKGLANVERAPEGACEGTRRHQRRFLNLVENERDGVHSDS
jgi:hypothetical protein